MSAALLPMFVARPGVVASVLSFRATNWQTVDSVSPSTHSVDDAFRRVQQGDRDAFASVYDALVDRVYGVVRRVLRDPAMSEEVTQEVFVEAWRTAARFDADRGTVSAWVVTMARRRAVDRVRSEQSQRDRVDALSAQPAATAARPDDEVISSLDVNRVQSAVAELPSDQRAVIEMCFLEGLSHGDIAEQLDIPLGTVKGRARGGLKKLRGRLGGAA